MRLDADRLSPTSFAQVLASMSPSHDDTPGSFRIVFHKTVAGIWCLNVCNVPLDLGPI